MTRMKSTHVDDPIAVGRRIRTLRESLKLRQADLAFPGCSAAYISRIESGDRIPSLQLLRELGGRLGVTADYLATGEEEVADADQTALVDAQLAHRLGDRSEAEREYERLREAGSPRVRSAALLGLAELAFDAARVTEAIELLEERARLVDPADPDVRAAECLAHAYASNGDLARALSHVEGRLQVADDPVSQFRLSVVLANILIDLNQLDRAETLIADLLAATGTAKDPVVLARTLWSQSRLQSARGNHELATRYAEDALAAIRTTEHDEYAARAHQLLAYIEIQRGRPERALELLESALPLVERSGDATRLALFQLDRARALADLGDYQRAHALATDLALRLEGLSPVDTARTLVILADGFEASGNTEHALETYAAAVEALGEHANEATLTDLYRRWTNLLVQAGRTDEALEVAQRALNRQAQSRTSRR